MQDSPTTILAVLVAGLMVFIGLMRWVVVFMEGAEKRRLELFERYEKVITENVRLKGRLILVTREAEEANLHAKFYSKELTRYKNKYEATLDKQLENK